MKICKKCLLSKPLEDFYKVRTNKDGRMGTCSHCFCENSKSWYEANKERKNKTSISWAKSHPQEVKDSARKFRLNNLEQFAERQRQRRIDNPQWYKDFEHRRNKTLKRKLQQTDKYYRRKTAIKGYSISQKEWETKLTQIGANCLYCGGHADTIDHLNPISRGGLHIISNVAPACRSCNSSKNDKTYEEYIAWREYANTKA